MEAGRAAGGAGGGGGALEARQAAIVLWARQLGALERLGQLERARGGGAPEGLEGPAPLPEGAGEKGAEVWAELVERGVEGFRMVLAPPEYYQRPLEFRMGVVGAASVDHLCKSIVMENTRAPEELQGCEDPTYSKYYMVIVQYTAKLNAEKLKSFVHGLAGGRLPKKKINMRLVSEEVNDRLTGFAHNAVTPMACATRIPLIISHKIPALSPDFFWLGSGEVDLKVGFSAAKFIEVYQPYVADCTND